MEGSYFIFQKRNSDSSALECLGHSNLRNSPGHWLLNLPTFKEATCLQPQVSPPFCRSEVCNSYAPEESHGVRPLSLPLIPTPRFPRVSTHCFLPPPCVVHPACSPGLLPFRVLWKSLICGWALSNLFDMQVNVFLIFYYPYIIGCLQGEDLFFLFLLWT